MAENAKLTDYVLGRLSTEEQSLIEQQYLNDPAIHDELRAAERDLIDQDVCGEMANPEQFERRVLSSPALRQRVEFARALNRSPSLAARRDAAVVAAEQRRQAHLWLRLIGATPRAWQAAAATVVLLIAGWLVISRMPPGPAPTGPSAPVAREESPSPAGPLNPGVPRSRQDQAPGPVRIATLVLAPSATRSSGEMPTLTLDGPTEVRLELYVEASGSERYLATIRYRGRRRDLAARGTVADSNTRGPGHRRHVAPWTACRRRLHAAIERSDR